MGTSYLQRARNLALIDSYKAKALKPRGPVYLPSEDRYWEQALVVALEDFASTARFIDDPSELEACRRRRRAYLMLARMTKHHLARSRYFSSAKLWRSYGAAAARYAAAMATLRGEQ